MTTYVAIERFRAMGEIAIGRVRSMILAARGALVGRKVYLGARVRVIRPWTVRLGTRCSIEEGVCLKVVDDQARLDVGEYTFIGRGTEFDIAGNVSIGAHVLIAPGCFITDHAHLTHPSLRIDQQPHETRPVSIESDVWIGAHSVVLPGVTIGRGAVIGAGAVVTRDVAPMSIVAGVPARILGHREG